MKKMLAFLFACHASFFAFQDANGQIINIPVDYPTIQQGIDAATDGDTVLVLPGTYLENINFNGKNITVASLFLITGDITYISQTIIDGDSITSVVIFENDEDSSAVLSGFTLTNGAGSEIFIPYSGSITMGGGIYIGYNASPTIKSLIIKGNYASRGGGILSAGSPYLSGVVIKDNVARNGGGILLSTPNTVFDTINRCQLYENYALFGNDLYCDLNIDIALDTFSVMVPTEYHAYPIGNFTFDILHCKIEQVESDLYVSPAGDNANNGLSAAEPLKNIRYAFSKILADEYHPHTVNLLSGTYSQSENGDVFPLNIPDYVSLHGESKSGTILDGEWLTAVMRIISNTGTSIKNLTVTNGVGGWESTGGSTAPYYWAGGITMHDHSDLIIKNVSVVGNSSGIYCTSDSSPVLDSLMIDGNQGDGLYCKWSCNATVTNTSITNNQGTGVNLDQSAPTLHNLIISGNTSSGIRLYSSSPVLKNIMIINNSAPDGGGMYIYPGNYNSTPSLENVTIAHNSASNKGGGIHCWFNTKPVFNPDNRCNIYLNEAPLGSDYYAEGQQNVVVDTFTVMYPTSHQAYPRSLYTFDILNAKTELIDVDLYVSPDGENTNSGLTAEEPLKNIHYAFSRIMADTNHQNTIHLMEGTYNTSSSGELFPIYMLDYTNLQGVSEDEVILDGEGHSTVLVIKNNVQNHLSNFTVTNGRGNNSWPVNYAGGIVNDNSSVKLSDITVKNNASGGISLLGNNQSELENVSVINNGDVWRGGGIFICGNGCNPLLRNVLVAGNQADDVGGGMYYSSHSNPTMINFTLSNNTAYNGSGSIFSQSNNSSGIVNSIIWNNSPPELYGTFTVAFSDIQGGYEGKGNIDLDPLFDSTGTLPYALSGTSPCINTGNPDTTGLFLPPRDLIGNSRIWENRIDMGAYEWNNLGFEEPQGKDENLWLCIYPNPAEDEAFVSAGSRQSAIGRHMILTIIDLYGREIRKLVEEMNSSGECTITMDVSRLPAGVYLVRMEAGEESTVSKLIVK